MRWRVPRSCQRLHPTTLTLICYYKCYKLSGCIIVVTAIPRARRANKHRHRHIDFSCNKRSLHFYAVACNFFAVDLLHESCLFCRKNYVLCLRQLID